MRLTVGDVAWTIRAPSIVVVAALSACASPPRGTSHASAAATPEPRPDAPSVAVSQPRSEGKDDGAREPLPPAPAYINDPTEAPVPSRARYDACCGGEEYASRCVSKVRSRGVASPFEIGPDIVFEGADQVAQTRAFASGAIGAEVSPDGGTILYVPAGKGVHLVPGGHVGRGIIESSTFAPDGNHVAIRSEEGELQVIDVASAKVERVVRGGRDPYFPNAREIVFRVGCQAMRASLQSQAPETELGPPACGETLVWDSALRFRVVVTKTNLEFGTSVSYSTISRVDLRTGHWEPLYAYGARIYYRSMRASRDGQRTCAIQIDQDAHRLTCRKVADGKPEILWHNHTDMIHELNETGGKVLFTGVKDGRMRVLLGDLVTHQVRSTGGDPRLSWRFLGGDGSRIVGFGGKEAYVLDLAQGIRYRVGTPKEEWEGFARVPKDANRFLLGRERGAGRDLFWVRLPSRSGR